MTFFLLEDTARSRGRKMTGKYGNLLNVSVRQSAVTGGSGLRIILIRIN